MWHFYPKQQKLLHVKVETNKSNQDCKLGRPELCNFLLQHLFLFYSRKSSSGNFWWLRFFNILVPLLSVLSSVDIFPYSVCILEYTNQIWEYTIHIREYFNHSANLPKYIRKDTDQIHTGILCSLSWS